MKRFKLKRKTKILNIILCFLLILTISLSFASSSYMKKISDKYFLSSNSPVIKTDSNIKRNEKIDDYINKLDKNLLVEEININRDIVSLLLVNDGKYESVIFDYVKGDKLSYEDLIKSKYREDFDAKISELLYLKYPKFIADVLNKNDKTNTYFFKDNELIIYYYNYEINPCVNEDLYLIVNYNEIKDYLNFNITLDANYNNENGYDVNNSKKLVAITFDDGPGSYTSRLADILNDNKAHSTFFMLGSNLLKFKDAVLKVYNNGNEIGYHSYEHTNFKRQSIEEIQNDFKISNEYLKSITGETFNLTRPPYGSINEDIKNCLDTSFILWSIDTEDWRHKDVDYLVNYVLDNIKEGSIILFHDIHKTSVDAIEKLLPELYVRGYQLVTVSKLADAYDDTLELHKTYRYFTR